MGVGGLGAARGKGQVRAGGGWTLCHTLFYTWFYTLLANSQFPSRVLRRELRAGLWLLV